jgi:hypothetical protein
MATIKDDIRQFFESEEFNQGLRDTVLQTAVPQVANRLTQLGVPSSFLQTLGSNIESATRANDPTPEGGTGFNFDAEEFQQNRAGPETNLATFEPVADLEPNALLKEVEAFSRELLTGELPQDVADQIKRNTAEASVQGGLSGQISRNLTARDIGQTSLDLKKQGAALGTGVSELQIREAEQRLRKDVFNREQSLRVSQHNEDIRQWEDNFANIMAESDLNRINTLGQLAINALGIEAANLRFGFQTQAQLFIANSTDEVPGLQGLLNEMSTGLSQNNADLARFLGPLEGILG